MANTKHNQFSFDKFQETDQLDDDTNTQQYLNRSNLTNIIQGLSISYASQGLLSLITAPINTTYTLLQMTNKYPQDLTNSQFAQKALMKIKDQKKKQIYKQFCDLNLFGQHRPFQKPYYEGYKDCFKKISNEGIQGLFKGNFTGFTYLFIQNIMKIEIHKFLFNKEAQNYEGISYLQLFSKSFIINSIIDILIQPLHTYQARLMYQDSRKHLRKYTSIFQYLNKQIKNRTLFRAWVSNIPINIIYALNVHPYIQQSPENLLKGLGLISLLTYPFMTIQRRLEIQSNHIKGFDQETYKNYYDAVKQIYKKEGLKQFYRGFIGFSIVKIYQSLIFYYVTKKNIVDLI